MVFFQVLFSVFLFDVIVCFIKSLSSLALGGKYEGVFDEGLSQGYFLNFEGSP